MAPEMSRGPRLFFAVMGAAFLGISVVADSVPLAITGATFLLMAAFVPEEREEGAEDEDQVEWTS